MKLGICRIKDKVTTYDSQVAPTPLTLPSKEKVGLDLSTHFFDR